MTFEQVMRDIYRSIAIIHGSGQFKLDICSEYASKAGLTLSRATNDAERDAARFHTDMWNRIVTAYSQEVKFYGRGLKPGYGIHTVFEQLFTLMGVEGIDWDYYSNVKILKPVSFATYQESVDDTNHVDDDYSHFEEESDELVADWMMTALTEEIAQAEAMNEWADALVDTMDVPADQLSIWKTINDYGHQFGAYSLTCKWQDFTPGTEKTFVAAGGVYALNDREGAE